MKALVTKSEAVNDKRDKDIFIIARDKSERCKARYKVSLSRTIKVTPPRKPNVFWSKKVAERHHSVSWAHQQMRAQTFWDHLCCHSKKNCELFGQLQGDTSKLGGGTTNNDDFRGSEHILVIA